MWTRERLAALLLTTLASGCGSGDDASEDDDGTTDTDPLTTPCFEWQRFMRHAGSGATQATSGPGDGEVTFENIGFVHAGSWELNFTVTAGERTDDVQLLLCVAGVLPFAQCYDADPSNDEGCEMAIDVRCRGDEQLAGDSVSSSTGWFDVEVVDIVPSPPNDEDAVSVTVRILDQEGAPVSSPEIAKGACTGMATAHDEP